MLRTKSTSAYLFFFLSLILLLVPQMVFAQDSEELKRLEAIKAEAEARAAIAKAKAEELNAKFPQADSKPLEGKTTVEDGTIEELLVGYVSIAGAADKIAANLHSRHSYIKKIAVYNDTDVKLLVAYSAAIKRVQIYKQRFEELIRKQEQALRDTERQLPGLVCTDDEGAAKVSDVGGTGFASIITPATSVLGGVVDLLSFLRTDVEIKGTVFSSVEESIVVSEVFRALRASYSGTGLQLYYPKEFPPDFDPMKDSPMLQEIESLYNSKDKADFNAAKINARIEQRKKRIDNLDECIALTNTKIGKVMEDKELTPQQRAAKIAALKGDIKTYNDEKATVQGEIAVLQQAIISQPNLNAQLDLLVKDLIKVDEKTGLNALTTFIQSENIQRLMKDEQSYWLKLSVVKAGGNTRIKRNLILDIFTFGNRVSYNGASTIEYHLYDNKGRSIASDTVTKYFDFMKGNKVEPLSDTYDQR